MFNSKCPIILIGFFSEVETSCNAGPMNIPSENEPVMIEIARDLSETVLAVA